jgi:toxin ParE1/3/4
MAEWFVSPAAREDLRSCWTCFAEDCGSPELAESFAAHSRLTFAKLTREPGLGRPYRNRDTALSGIRPWRVAGFPKVLVFYRERDAVVEIIRVIHGARDLENALADT